MNAKKQQLVLDYLVSSPDIFSNCITVIQPEYFDPEFRKTVKFVIDYFNEYHAVPTCKQVNAETGIKLEPIQVTKDQIEWTCKEIESFCKQRALVKAIYAAGEFIEREDFGMIERLIKEAIAVSLERSVGTEFFTNPEIEMAKLKESYVSYPCGLSDFDRCLGDGFRRKEMLLLSANSGVGKSIMMTNLGLMLSRKHGLNVLYLSLELPVPMIYKRMVSMVTNIAQPEILGRADEAAAVIRSVSGKYGHYVIEQLPVGSNANRIRALLRDFETKYGYLPDVLIHDYIDLAAPNERVSADNVFQRDKMATEEYRQILIDYDMIGITASQQNRGAVTAADLNQSHIAGGISKINTTDFYVSIIRTEAMMAQNRVGFMFLKTRSSSSLGETIYAKWDKQTLIVSELDVEGTPQLLDNFRKAGSANVAAPPSDEDRFTELLNF